MKKSYIRIFFYYSVHDHRYCIMQLNRPSCPNWALACCSQDSDASKRSTHASTALISGIWLSVIVCSLDQPGACLSRCACQKPEQKLGKRR